jgi:hypothetical protein
VDVVDDGVFSSKAAPAGMPPEGGGTGRNKLLSERESVGVAGSLVWAGATLGAAVIGGFSIGGGVEGMVVAAAG